MKHPPSSLYSRITLHWLAFTESHKTDSIHTLLETNTTLIPFLLFANNCKFFKSDTTITNLSMKVLDT